MSCRTHGRTYEFIAVASRHSLRVVPRVHLAESRVLTFAYVAMSLTAYPYDEVEAAVLVVT